MFENGNQRGTPPEQNVDESHDTMGVHELRNRGGNNCNGRADSTHSSQFTATKRTMLTEAELAQRFHEQRPESKPLLSAMKSKCLNTNWTQNALSLFPVISWAKQYSIRNDLLPDAVAGLTVGILVIPQGLSYGLLAGLPAIYGLYAILAAPLVYMLVGASPEVHLGPFALVSLLVLDTVGGVVDMESEGEEVYQEAVVTVTLIVGVILIGLSLLQLGVLVEFLSEPVMSGLTTAGAVLIATSQLKHLCGLNIPSMPFYDTIYYLFDHINEVNWVTFGLGISSLVVQAAIDEGNKRIQRLKNVKIPSGLIVLVIGILIVQGLNLSDEHEVRVLGEIPQGLPAPRVPGELHRIGRLIVPSLVIAVVGYALTMATEKTFATRKGRDVPANQELFALSAANVVASFFLGYPAFASLSRSAVVDSVGAHTPLHNLFSTLIVILVLQFLTEQLFFLPYAILSSVIFLSLKNLFKQFVVPFQLWKATKADAVVWVFTFFMTLSLQIVYGLVGGVVLSIVLLLRSVSRPSVAVLGMLPDVMLYKDNRRYRNAISVPGILLFRFDSPLHFANKDYFNKSLTKALKVRLTVGQVKRYKERIQNKGKEDSKQVVLLIEPTNNNNSSEPSNHATTREHDDIASVPNETENDHAVDADRPVELESSNERGTEVVVLSDINLSQAAHEEPSRIAADQHYRPESTSTITLMEDEDDVESQYLESTHSTSRSQPVQSMDKRSSIGDDSIAEYQLHNDECFREHIYEAKVRLDSHRGSSVGSEPMVDMVAIIVDAAGITDMDSSALNALKRKQSELRENYNIEIMFANCRGRVRDMLLSAGVDIRTFLSIDAAVLFCRRNLFVV